MSTVSLVELNLLKTKVHTEKLTVHIANTDQATQCKVIRPTPLILH